MGRQLVKVAKILLVVLPTIGIVLLLAAILIPSKPRAQQIEEGCMREFESQGMARVRQCQIEIMSREMEQAERDRMTRAAG